MALADPAQQSIQPGARLGRRQAAQHVVGAEFDDDAIGAVAERPVEAGETGGHRVAGDAGVDDADVVAALAQRRFEANGKGGAGRQTIAGRQAVAEGEEAQRPGLGRQSQDQGSQQHGGKAKNFHVLLTRLAMVATARLWQACDGVATGHLKAIVEGWA